MASKKVLLIGPPGSGKTLMITKTAVRRPVHVLDVDRKIGSSGMLTKELASQDVTYKEVAETLDEETLMDRIKQLTKNEALVRQPKGWQVICEAIYNLPKTEEGKRAETWVIDSLTLAGEHLKSLIMYFAKKNKYTWDQWNAYLIGWRDTIKIATDIAAEHGKDIMMTVHERTKETVGDRVRGVTMNKVVTPEGVQMVREYQGTMDVKIVASLDGSFGEHIGAYFDDYYALSVEIQNDKPIWRCRVRPDGRRDLRCSFPVTQDEYEPDFHKIWSAK